MLKQRYKSVRDRSLILSHNFHSEDYNLQADYFVSPPKWHLAHTTWFFEQMVLQNHLHDYEVFHADFSLLFNSYYNTLGKRIDRRWRGLITRPTVTEVLAYRKYVDSAILKLIESPQLTAQIKSLITLGLQHEQQHQELMQTDIKYSLSFNPVYPSICQKNDCVHQTNTEKGWLNISEGIYEIGFEGDGFCFDNELGKHKIFLHKFQLSRSLVTNAEFVDFIEAGGYQYANFWLDNGWHWIQQNKIAHPLYWTKQDNKWHQYTLAGLKEIKPDEVLAHISFFEAQAFANWKGLRLPTEFEWEIAASQLSWGSRWEWTNSAYLPYPGFKIKEGAVGEYNGKFMSNQMVLRGASGYTAKNHSRISYRNFFSAESQWQLTGIRLTKG